MAEWKKIVVSGSDISQLNNDSGYLSSTGTIDSASVAARATTLSPDATASFADLASDARTADSASVAARATLLSSDATASFADLASDARTADSASVAARATTLSDLATASFADLASDARTATSASFATQAGSSRNSDSASVAARATTLSPEATASFADLASDARTSDSASVAARATTLSADATASFADLASDARTATSASFATQAGTSRAADSASVAARATELSDLATASFADLAGTARTTDSASVAARATTLSADATASYADLAGTVHDGNITNAKIAVGTIANDRLVNDSVTLGTTEVDLGQTVTSIVGLENISAATGTFVYQIFESSSTIITSGSNVFGNDENDIQQFTGSILQTGSMIISGGLDVAVGQISGSFVGDGSGLTGLATVLTVDGDTGTQNVDLIADDLQFLGTTDRIDTVVTKVGNDVKVTFDLPDTLEVTASVAARATTLSADATASFADLASDARTATSASFATQAGSSRNADSASVAARATTLSADATASFADLASDARTATSASIAQTATSASATIAGVLFPVADGLSGQALVTDGAGTFTYGDVFGTGSTKKLNQTVAAATWSFQHSLDEVYPIVQAYDSNGDQMIPERIESIDANNIKLYFAESTAGVAAAMVGGMGISASNATRATSASIADEASTLSATATASFADLASVARTADSASVAARATELSDLATASFADVAGDARTATSASHATSGAGAFSGSFIGDGSGLTGLATVLTLDGDTGTQNVDLIDDDLQIIGTAQEISTAVTKVGNDVKVTLSLPDNVTIGNNLTVTNDATIAGDLVVGGSIVSASSLAVEDQFIILASGSNGAIDGGIIINQIDDDPDGKGKAFAFDSSANRWALESNLNDTASVITPDAFMGVIQEGTFNAGTAPLYGSTAGKGTIFVDDGGDVYIYG